jgi:hypothetical protein
MALTLGAIGTGIAAGAGAIATGVAGVSGAIGLTGALGAIGGAGLSVLGAIPGATALFGLGAPGAGLLGSLAGATGLTGLGEGLLGIGVPGFGALGQLGGALAPLGIDLPGGGLGSILSAVKGTVPGLGGGFDQTGAPPAGPRPGLGDLSQAERDALEAGGIADKATSGKEKVITGKAPKGGRGALFDEIDEFLGIVGSSLSESEDRSLSRELADRQSALLAGGNRAPQIPPNTALTSLAQLLSQAGSPLGSALNF